MQIKTFNANNIIGIKLQTANENGKAFEEIPLLWKSFFQEKIIEKIPNKISDDIYGVYTDFVNAGKNNKDGYSLIIGCCVDSLEDIPAGLVTTTIPAGHYSVFESEAGQNEKVYLTWQKIWQKSAEDTEFNQQRTYLCEFEQYKSTGEINVYIGMKSA